MMPQPRPKWISPAACGALLALSIASAHAQTPTPNIGRSSGKNRIVFDYTETPTPTPTPAPTPSSTWKPEPAFVEKGLPPGDGPTGPEGAPPRPTPEPVAGPDAEPSPTPPPPPTPEPTPEPTPTPEATPEPASEARVEPAEASPPPAPVVVEESSTVQEEQAPDAIVTEEETVVAASTPEPAPSEAQTPPEPASTGLGEAIAESAPQESVGQAPPEVVAPAGPEGPLPGASGDSPDVLADAEGLELMPSESGMTPSESVTINLISKLVERGILTKEDAASMIKQAEAEAEVARAQAQADMFAVAQIAAAQAAADQIAIDQALAAPSEDDVRVTYIPEPVRMQIKEDIKSELMAETKHRPFNNINLLPAWVNAIHPFGDIRVRFEGDLFSSTNDASGAFPDFDAINTGAPFDVTGTEFAPQLNADQNRYRFRIRARLGLAVAMSDNFSMGFRIATGSDNSPVSTNQTLGGSGGQFSKYQLWLDRAFIKYQLWGETTRNFEFWAGRFDNPFMATPLIWDDDIGFDGFAARLQYEIFEGFRPFIAGGAFPVYNTDFNFSTNQPSKFKSYDKYLFAVQGGFQWSFADNWTFAVGTAYYHFYNIEGRLSSPFTPLTDSDAGDTDNSRPSFAQKGNTYFPIRNIVPDASNDFGAINQWQYYGLATKFQELAVTARLDYTGFEPVVVSLIGEFVTNLAWDEADIDAIAVNNRGEIDPDDIDDILGDYEGSPYAWLVQLQVGHTDFKKRWDWNFAFTYRWIGSDSVVDGFNDSDFGLGGTNMQGFTVGGGLAIAPNIWLGARWLGSRSIAGPQYDVNIFQIDLNGRF